VSVRSFFISLGFFLSRYALFLHAWKRNHETWALPRDVLFKLYDHLPSRSYARNTVSPQNPLKRSQQCSLLENYEVIWSFCARFGNVPLVGMSVLLVAAPDLRKGDYVLVEAGDVIPGDGEVVEGVASVDESAITGESAPVIINVPQHLRAAK
jgi:hypothetical protein